MAGRPLNDEFFGDVKDIILQPSFLIPVDVFDREAFCITGDRLWQAFTQHQQVINFSHSSAPARHRRRP